jgi:hypothetical protein
LGEDRTSLAEKDFAAVWASLMRFVETAAATVPDTKYINHLAFDSEEYPGPVCNVWANSQVKRWLLPISGTSEAQPLRLPAPAAISELRWRLVLP